MIIGIPKEIKEDEYRVGITPSGVRSFTEAGHHVLVEKGAGLGSAIPDAEYLAAGAAMISSKKKLFCEAELILKVKEPLKAEYNFLQEGQILCCFLHLASDRVLTLELLKRKISSIAYETVMCDDGTLPLLKPMSEIAGRLAVQNGAYALQRPQGGRGTLLSGVPGVERGFVVILGAGIVGSNAAKIAIGLGARVVVLDLNVERLGIIEHLLDGRVETAVANRDTIEGYLTQADLLIGAVLVAGAKAPTLVTRAMLKKMKQGTVMVDVSIDQGGCFETSRPTRHTAPTYLVDGIVHYCVPNIPGAVPRTSTYALSHVTLPYIRKISDDGLNHALQSNLSLQHGLNTQNGEVTCAPVARAHGLKFSRNIMAEL